jgi:hypothetical protein
MTSLRTPDPEPEGQPEQLAREGKAFGPKGKGRDGPRVYARAPVRPCAEGWCGVQVAGGEGSPATAGAERVLPIQHVSTTPGLLPNDIIYFTLTMCKIIRAQQAQSYM